MTLTRIPRQEEASSVKVKEVVADIDVVGERAIAVQPDVSDVARAETLFSLTRDAFGTVDVVVNNAGMEIFRGNINRIEMVAPTGFGSGTCPLSCPSKT